MKDALLWETVPDLAFDHITNYVNTVCHNPTQIEFWSSPVSYTVTSSVISLAANLQRDWYSQPNKYWVQNVHIYMYHWLINDCSQQIPYQVSNMEYLVSCSSVMREGFNCFGSIHEEGYTCHTTSIRHMDCSLTNIESRDMREAIRPCCTLG
jgi:hypothetical protein